jgi:hypothetical protein
MEKEYATTTKVLTSTSHFGTSSSVWIGPTNALVLLLVLHSPSNSPRRSKQKRDKMANGEAGAEYLASIYGTEKDKYGCPLTACNLFSLGHVAVAAKVAGDVSGNHLCSVLDSPRVNEVGA